MYKVGLNLSCGFYHKFNYVCQNLNFLKYKPLVLIQFNSTTTTDILNSFHPSLYVLFTSLIISWRLFEIMKFKIDIYIPVVQKQKGLGSI